ncbi:hypothetical protein MTO96_039038 [Rhipicephalus appendiculatus]
MTSTNLPMAYGLVDQGVINVDSVGSAAAAVAAAVYNATADFAESSTVADVKRSSSSRRPRVSAVPP